MRETGYYSLLLALELIFGLTPVIIFWCIGIVYFIPTLLLWDYEAIKDILRGTVFLAYLSIFLGGAGLWGIFRAFKAIVFPREIEKNQNVTKFLMLCGVLALLLFSCFIDISFNYLSIFLLLPILITVHLWYLLNRAQ